MLPETLQDFHSLATDVEKIRISIQGIADYHWWDTQWFAALIGAFVGTITTITVGAWRDRRKILENWYSHIVERQQSEHIFRIAAMTRYGGKTIKDGEITITPEKLPSERILIEFRKNYKYWNLPMSCLRFLFWRYEKTLSKLPNLNQQELSKSPEYLKAHKIFAKIIKLSERKTGENQWTIRESH